MFARRVQILPRNFRILYVPPVDMHVPLIPYLVSRTAGTSALAQDKSV